MPKIVVKTIINAPVEKCFDLARDIDFYCKSLNKSTEIPVAGKTSGLIEKNDIMVWETDHLGFMQHLTLKISEFIKPCMFVDEMIEGRFKVYKHGHLFEKQNQATVMIDDFYFESSYGIFGKLLDILIFKRHFKKLILTRNVILKQKAEAGV